MKSRKIFEKLHEAEAPNYIYAYIVGIEHDKGRVEYSVDSNVAGGYRSFGTDKKAAMVYFEDIVKPRH